MKKNFPLRVAGKADARVVDSIKHDVRKYVKRERRKTLPDGFDQWDFACKVGATAIAAEAQSLKEVSAAIDQIVTSGGADVYVEVIAVAAHRIPRAGASADPGLSLVATAVQTAPVSAAADGAAPQSS